jgi:hypothetical protein
MPSNGTPTSGGSLTWYLSCCEICGADCDVDPDKPVDEPVICSDVCAKAYAWERAADRDG